MSYIRKTSGQYHFWSNDDDRRLAELYKSHTAKECADTMELSFASVKNRIRELIRRNHLTITHRAWTPAEERRLADLFHAGMTYIQIGEELGRSASAISNAVNRLKLHRKNHPSKKVLTIHQQEWMRKNYRHVSVAFAARIIGMSAGTLAKRAAEMGLAKNGKRVNYKD